MIARRKVPDAFTEWNAKWGAPYGFPAAEARAVESRLGDPEPTRYGLFGFQHNSPTRTFEYPWAFHQAGLRPGMTVMDVGGGISGFQYVLAKAGCKVVTVDPLLPEDHRWSAALDGDAGWFTQSDHTRMNELFGTDVTLVPERVQDYAASAGSFDRIFCLSVLEHVDVNEAQSMLKRIGDLLAPGGQALLTVDLFLDLKPFGVRTENFWGTNLDLSKVLDGVELEMVHGDRRELHGFAEFDVDRIVGLLPEIRVAKLYPVMIQTMVLRKPE